MTYAQAHVTILLSTYNILRMLYVGVSDLDAWLGIGLNMPVFSRGFPSSTICKVSYISHESGRGPVFLLVRQL